MTNQIQISGKAGDIIVVLGGKDAAEFQDNVLAVLGPEAGEAVGAMFQTALLEKFATTNLIDAGMAQQNQATPAQQAVTTPSPSSSGPKEETDNWGGVWTYEIPGAPSCPHGARVQKVAKSKAGKMYTAWCCPTASPSAYRNKVAKADCAMEFAK